MPETKIVDLEKLFKIGIQKFFDLTSRRVRIFSFCTAAPGLFSIGKQIPISLSLSLSPSRRGVRMHIISISVNSFTYGNYSGQILYKQIYIYIYIIGVHIYMHTHKYICLDIYTYIFAYAYS